MFFDSKKLDNAKDIDVVIPMYNLIEYSNNFSKRSWSLWQYYWVEKTLTDPGAIDNVSGNSAPFKFIQKLTGYTGNNVLKELKWYNFYCYMEENYSKIQKIIEKILESLFLISIIWHQTHYFFENYQQLLIIISHYFIIGH